MKFRKKPVVIEARPLENIGKPRCDACAAVDWIRGNGGSASCDGLSLYIQTLEGTMKAAVGDWVLHGVAGEFYSCKPEIFAATYERVDGD